MATVSELTEPFANYLVPVLPAAPGVCAVCWTSVAGYQTCWSCKEVIRAFGDARADVVVPVALAIKADDPRAGIKGQFAYELNAYKNHRLRSTREQLSLRLAALLWRFLHDHEQCVCEAAGVERFDIVATVPSTGGRIGSHPMEAIIAMVGATRDRYLPCVVNPSVVFQGRELATERFRCEGDVSGRSVLVVDDQWTTGNHAQSAAHVLKRAGAAKVAVVVLGRRFVPSWDGPNTDCAGYFDIARDRPFRWDRCCLEEE